MTQQVPSQLIPGILGIPISLYFLISVILVAKSGKRRLEDIWYLIFWFFGFLFWLFNSIGLIFWNYNFPLANIFMIIGYGWIMFHIASGPFYLLSKITTNKIAHSILAVLTLPFVVYYLVDFLPKMHLVRGKQVVYYNAPGFPLHGYTLALLITIMVGPSIYVIIKGFKAGEMSLENLSSFYAFYALVVYAGLSVPAVLNIRGVIVLQPFYLLIPYLVYLGYRKKREKNNKL